MSHCLRCLELGTTCDLLLPSCSLCTLAAVPCSFAVLIDWTPPTSSPPSSLALALPSPSPPPSPSSWTTPPVLRPLSLLPDASPFELRGIAHFLRGVSPTLVAIDIPSNPNFTYLPLSLSASSKALFHALVAAGGAHARNWGLQVSLAEIAREERKALELLESDLVGLGKRMRDKKATDGELARAVNEILAVLQTLILLASTAGDVKLWRQHLMGAANLIAQVNRVKAGKQPLVLDTFLLETIRYLDMQASMALDTGTTIPQSMSESGWDPSQVIVNPSVTGMHGFSRNYLDAASRISDLSHSLHSSSPPSSPSSPSPETSSTIYSALESTKAQLVLLEHDPSFRAALLQRLSLSSTHVEQLDGHFRFADCCYFACHVYLARTVCEGRRALGEEGRAFLYGGLDALGRVPWEGSAGNLLGWVLVIIGAELENDEPARGIVRLRMKALAALGHRNLEQCAELLEEVWKRKDALGEEEVVERVTWQGTMKEMGWDLLVA